MKNLLKSLSLIVLWILVSGSLIFVSDEKRIERIKYRWRNAPVYKRCDAHATAGFIRGPYDADEVRCRLWGTFSRRTVSLSEPKTASGVITVWVYEVRGHPAHEDRWEIPTNDIEVAKRAAVALASNTEVSSQ